MVSLGSGSDPFDRDSDLLLNVLDILLCVWRELLPVFHAHGVRFPAGKRFVDDLHLLQYLKVSREGFEFLAIETVRNRDLYLIKVVKDIQFRQVERSVVVDSVAVAAHDKVQPTTTATTACRNTKLPARNLQLLSDFVDLLRGEGAGANASAVSLYDTDNILDGLWVEGKPLDGTTKTSARRSDVGICSVVEVEHESIGSLNEDGGGGLVFANEGKLVDDMGLEARTIFLNPRSRISNYDGLCHMRDALMVKFIP